MSHLHLSCYYDTVIRNADNSKAFPNPTTFTHSHRNDLEDRPVSSVCVHCFVPSSSPRGHDFGSPLPISHQDVFELTLLLEA